jgi:uncharacterized protein YdhG (YjbR/CyaY superfamily)
LRSENSRTNVVDDYISQHSVEVRKALEEVRSSIRKAAPKAEETINYNIPAFTLVEGGKRDQQIMFAGYKKHIGFYPHPSVIERFKGELKEFKIAKGSVQFSLEKPIPKDLIVRMVKYRLAELTRDD